MSGIKKIDGYEHLFDRRRVDHPWFPALSRLADSEYAETRALAGNWRMDHRVAKKREDELLESTAFHDLERRGVAFESAIGAYFQDALCRPRIAGAGLPAYMADANRDNRVAKDRIAPNAHLLHLASLEALLRKIPEWRYFDVEETLFQWTGEYPPEQEALIKPGQLDRIARGLQRAGADAIREFAGVIADSLGAAEPHWWAAFAYDIDPYMEDEDWSRAARVLGLGHLMEGQWLLAWRYPVDWAGPLYRPASVEAARSGYHYPSPPGEDFGITMPLSGELPAVKEVIHAPLKGDTNTDACLGRLGRIAAPPVEVDNPRDTDWLGRRRQDHAKRLAGLYGRPGVDNWLARHGLLERV